MQDNTDIKSSLSFLTRKHRISYGQCSFYFEKLERSEHHTECQNASPLYDIYTPATCRCPRLFVNDSLGVTTPLVEYTYACTSSPVETSMTSDMTVYSTTTGVAVDATTSYSSTS